MTLELKPSEETAGLHRREYEVLIGLCNNWKLAQIGERYGLSANTLITYRNRLYKALGAHSAGEAVQTAWRRGLLHTCPTCRRPR